MNLSLQELSDDFRVSYCKLWQALIREDQVAIKQHCVELHAGSLYRLLACMVTARAWANIEAGITNSNRSEAEVSQKIYKGELYKMFGMVQYLGPHFTLGKNIFTGTC